MAPRELAAALLLGLALLAPTGEQPRFAPAEGSRVRRTIELSGRSELVGFDSRMNGEPLPKEVTEAFETILREKHRVELVDELVRMGDGRPLELVRRFERLRGSVHEAHVEPDGGRRELSLESWSDLEGRAARFTWDAERQRYTARFLDGSGDDTLLERLQEDLDLRGFLPGREVSDGDRWEVPLGAFYRVLALNHDLAFEEEDSLPPDPAYRRQLRDNFQGKVTATWRGLRELDGRRLGVIGVEAQVRTYGRRRVDDRRVRMRIEHDAEGELTWDLDAARAARLTLDNAFRYRGAVTWSETTDEGVFDSAQGKVYLGTQRIDLRVEPEE